MFTVHSVEVCPKLNKESLSFNFTGRGNYCIKAMDYYVVGQTPAMVDAHKNKACTNM